MHPHSLIEAHFQSEAKTNAGGELAMSIKMAHGSGIGLLLNQPVETTLKGGGDGGGMVALAHSES
jgi:hypothetical protein